VNRDGDMVIGYSGSSAQDYVSAFYSCRFNGCSTCGTPALLKQGVDFLGHEEITIIRFGDYSFTTLDPTDGQTIWTVQAYAEIRVSENLDPVWGTSIGRFHPVP